MHSRQAAAFRRVPGHGPGGGAVQAAAPGAAPVRAATAPLLRPSAVPTVLRGQDLEQPPAAVDQVLRRPGAPLDAGTRSLMEQRLGADFGHVRVHADEHAAAAAHALGAEAYTVGGSIVFASRRYAPDGEEGRELLAHELVHTMQQDASGPAVSGRRLSVESQDSAAEGEARRTARAARADGLPHAGPGPGRVPADISPSRIPPTGTIQCQKAPGRYRVTQPTPLRELTTYAERFQLAPGTEVGVMDKGNRASNFRPTTFSFLKREHSYSSAPQGAGNYNGWIDDAALEQLARPALTGPPGIGPRQDDGPATARPSQLPSTQPPSIQPPSTQPPSVQGVPLLFEAARGSRLEQTLIELGHAEAALRQGGTAAPPPKNFAELTVNRAGRTEQGLKDISGVNTGHRPAKENQPNLTVADKVYVKFGLPAIQGQISDFNFTLMQRISEILVRANELGYHVEDEGLQKLIVSAANRLAEEGHHSTVATSLAQTGHVTFKDNA
jgi:hypothetical protein